MSSLMSEARPAAFIIIIIMHFRVNSSPSQGVGLSGGSPDLLSPIIPVTGHVGRKVAGMKVLHDVVHPCLSRSPSTSGPHNFQCLALLCPGVAAICVPKPAEPVSSEADVKVGYAKLAVEYSCVCVFLSVGTTDPSYHSSLITQQLGAFLGSKHPTLAGVQHDASNTRGVDPSSSVET